jgi:hypothetical protein
MRTARSRTSGGNCLGIITIFLTEDSGIKPGTVHSPDLSGLGGTTGVGLVHFGGLIRSLTNPFKEVVSPHSIAPQ